MSLFLPTAIQFVPMIRRAPPIASYFAGRSGDFSEKAT
jgi:hypothetical protein